MTCTGGTLLALSSRGAHVGMYEGKHVMGHQIQEETCQCCKILQKLLNIPQLELKICTAETTAKLHKSGANWGMFSKFCNTLNIMMYCSQEKFSANAKYSPDSVQEAASAVSSMQILLWVDACPDCVAIMQHHRDYRISIYSLCGRVEQSAETSHSVLWGLRV